MSWVQGMATIVNNLSKTCITCIQAYVHSTDGLVGGPPSGFWNRGHWLEDFGITNLTTMLSAMSVSPGKQSNTGFAAVIRLM